LATLAIQAAANGAIALMQARVPRDAVIATGSLLFEAVLKEITKANIRSVIGQPIRRSFREPGKV
jgi:hypothetical protein